ncbi:hypothetical protein F5Y15DRAFT_338289 [Xylariaceae sp. FL0016]|nr:hypothetical protein F5Y15DRAFT_338289 [Xylariaceae sp. FL0016]
MPRGPAQPTALYCDLPLAFVPLINSALILIKLYHWQQSQYIRLLNFVDETMEQTSTELTNAQAPITFTQFNDLPPELRIKIWQYAMPPARTVVVKSPHTRQKPTPTSLEDALPSEYDNEETWQSATQIPALLHVNAEARHEALQTYTLSLGVGKSQPRIYVDFSRDTVFFGHHELKPECSPLWAETQGLNKVQRLAVVPEGAWRVLRWKKVDLNSLEKMIFVHDTEKLKLGPLPELVEDAEPAVNPEVDAHELETQFEQIKQGNLLDAEMTSKIVEMKKRMQAAREELDTLLMVLPTHWEKEPAVSTAVFKKVRGDKWVC